MGLKQDLLNAKLEALKADGATEEALNMAMQDDSPLAKQAEMEKEAILKFLTKSDFTITQLKAPVIIENFKTPDQPVNVGLQTLLGEYGPILDTLRKITTPLGQEQLINTLEKSIKKVVEPLLEGGATLPGLDLEKGDLQSTGYVYVGEDPDSQDTFDVDDEEGQRTFTTVVLKEEDARKNQ
tara:strand:- start:464 stop:1009 length:546 start_codon:yes stop_codon:yes gene_type:complete